MEEVVVAEPEPQAMLGVAVFIHNPRLAQQFLAAANQCYPPFEDTQHLKRIRKPLLPTCADADKTDASSSPLELLLLSGVACGTCLRAHETLGDNSESTSLTDRADTLPAVFSSFSELIAQKCGEEARNALRYHLVRVPDRAPRRSPELWARWSQLWPLASPKPSPPDVPGEAEVAQASMIMRHTVLPLCRRTSARTPPLLAVAAALVDPATHQVLLTSADCDTMVSTNLACGCAYAPPSVTDCRRAGELGVAAASTAIVDEHPVMYVLRRLVKIQQDDQGDCSSGGMLDSSLSPQHAEASGGEGDARPYLANGLDVYVSHEPCVMCAMALVHSRVRHVYYCFPNNAHGGLGSAFAVHTIPSLNHHFRVFRCTAFDNEGVHRDGLS